MIVLVTTFVLSVLLCGLYRHLALQWRVLDLPNERSSHRDPTPHGGGLPMLTAFLVGALLTAHSIGPADGHYGLILLTTLLLMVVGILDDLRGLSVRLRLPLYGLCCLVTAGAMLAPVLMTAAPRHYLLVPLTALAMLWLVNLYNFMDGIDGLAASQCILACMAAAMLAWWLQASHDYVVFCLLLAAAQLGFLVWNWPPARLFMGDAGSIPTGFLLAVLALQGGVRNELPVACWLILLAVFITDASFTLGWRVLAGQPFTRPHRQHAYQRLSRHWQAHLPVDLLLLVLFLFWLLPLAALVAYFPRHDFLLVILAYFPLLAGMVKFTKFA
jgi:Fuc2NAc and GlcNAc transferase